jgi:3-hydroxybutyryl-CoA dehydrogenase
MQQITIGIIGSGAMGAGIAQVVATAGHPVRLLDQNAAALEKATTSIAASLRRLAEKGKLTAEAAEAAVACLHPTETMADFADCGLVIEAIVEDLEVKQQVFRGVEAIVSADCWLASNTSSLSITAIAAACQRPERFVGIHFFNPAPLMQLVEVIPAVQTRTGLAEEVKALVASWNKRPVLAQDTPGFIVNRVARPFYGEAIRIHRLGHDGPRWLPHGAVCADGFYRPRRELSRHGIGVQGLFLRPALPALLHPKAAF